MHENLAVKFIFPNILLPDSNVNEPLSHGYVQYRIKQRAGNQIGDRIDNSASIYFDFNEAIVTNTTQSLIVAPLNVEEQPLFDASIYPNPTINELTIASEEQLQEISVTSTTGQLLLRNRASSNQVKISTVDWSPGIYIVRLKTNIGTRAYKVIKR